jgi:hypothetical protein
MRVTYSGVTATLALTLAISTGGAYAADKVLPKNSVTTKTIRNGQVKAKDLGANAVRSNKVAPNALTGADVSEPTFAKVPAAGSADRATSAARADVAARAETADRAETAARSSLADRASNVLWATVGSTGALVGAESSGALSSVKAATGAYHVSFGRDVSQCAAQVTLRDEDPASTSFTLGTASVDRFSQISDDAEKEKKVIVLTMKGGVAEPFDGTEAANKSFTLTMFC